MSALQGSDTWRMMEQQVLMLPLLLGLQKGSYFSIENWYPTISDGEAEASPPQKALGSISESIFLQDTR